MEVGCGFGPPGIVSRLADNLILRSPRGVGPQSVVSGGSASPTDPDLGTACELGTADIIVRRRFLPIQATLRRRQVKVLLVIVCVRVFDRSGPR